MVENDGLHEALHEALPEALQDHTPVMQQDHNSLPPDPVSDGDAGLTGDGAAPGGGTLGKCAALGLPVWSPTTVLPELDGAAPVERRGALTAVPAVGVPDSCR